MAVQYHPEYISRPLKPSPPYLGLLLAATGKIKSFFNRGCQLSPEMSYSEGESEEVELNNSFSSIKQNGIVHSSDSD